MQVLPVILDEFGSTLNNTKEMECMTSIEAYVNAIAPASTTSHAPISSWFFWCGSTACDCRAGSASSGPHPSPRPVSAACWDVSRGRRIYFSAAADYMQPCTFLLL